MVQIGKNYKDETVNGNVNECKGWNCIAVVGFFFKIRSPNQMQNCMQEFHLNLISILIKNHRAQTNAKRAQRAQNVLWAGPVCVICYS